eukprot:m.308452 g.308452  ORF g.308452 m.308452 type:complete len:72 (-) comp16473_c0_seq6:22-237(-)
MEEGEDMDDLSANLILRHFLTQLPNAELDDTTEDIAVNNDINVQPVSLSNTSAWNCPFHDCVPNPFLISLL